MTGITGAVAWLLIAVLLFVIEGATVQLVCVWFAGGAVVAMLSALFGAPLNLQLVLFFISSIVILLVGRPLLKDKLIPKKTATNADAVIGKTGVVIEAIDNINEVGRVMTNGLDWSARSGDGRPIDAKQVVTVKAIDGVKLIVEKVTDE